MKNLTALRFVVFVVFFLSFILLFSVYASSINIATASYKTFEDNFDNIPNGSFPNKWILAPDPFLPQCPQAWYVDNGVLKISVNTGPCSTNIVPLDSEWNGFGNNYVFELDVTFISGVDHNIVYRMFPLTDGFIKDFYELHFQSPGDFTLSAPAGTYSVFNSRNYDFNKTFHIKIIVNEKNIKVFIDGNLVRDYTSLTDIPSGKVALRTGTGAVIYSETWFDNIKITSLDDVPSPTPTSSPTPIPISDLDVHSLKQTSDPWQSQIYDAANKWAANSPSIASWGCALTSATMILNYHGINKLPNGTILDPGTLNFWLKSQKDGYIGTGWINWLAVSRLSKLSKSINGITKFDALEYLMTYTENSDRVTSDIKNSNPDILGVSGHFIVAKGINKNTFNINDPYYNRTTLNDYGNHFYSIGTYKPSNTDLSYIMLSTNPDINIEVKNSNNSTVGENFVQEPINNPLNSVQINLPIKIFYLPQPTDKNYKLKISSFTDKIYNLGVYLYDRDGNVNILNQTGFTNPSKSDNYTIKFDKQTSTNSTNSKIVTFQTLIDDINEASKLNLVKPQMAKDLIKFAKRTQQDYERNKRVGKLELAILQAILKAINKTPLIKESAYLIINYDVGYLKSHL